MNDKGEQVSSIQFKTLYSAITDWKQATEFTMTNFGRFANIIAKRGLDNVVLARATLSCAHLRKHRQAGMRYYKKLESAVQIRAQKVRNARRTAAAIERRRALRTFF